MTQYITRTLAAVIPLAMTMTACTTPTPTEPATPAAAPAPAADNTYTPVVSLNEIMVYVVDPHANEIWDAATRPPATDADWRALNRAAVAIAAAGNLTKLAGNGPKDQEWTQQANWVGHSQAVADAGLAAVEAVRARNSAQLSKAGDQLVLTCINCHREYRLELPSIWTERQLPPEEQPR